MNDLNKKLKLLKEEDIIWIIYVFIAFAALLSNKYEKEYIITKNKNAYKKYKNINICIFIIAFFIYLYFTMITYNSLKELKDNFEKYKYSQAKLIAAILFLVGGLIYLIVEIISNDSEEIAII